MKYNVGDKVFNIGAIDFFDNWYHYKKYMRNAVDTVKKANKDYFTIYEEFDIEHDFCGMHSYQRFNQNYGRSASYPVPDILLHCEKDKEKIENLIREHFQKKYKEVAEEIVKQIEDTKHKTKLLENKLEDLKSKKVEIVCLSDDAYKWLGEREQEALNLLE